MAFMEPQTDKLNQDDCDLINENREPGDDYKRKPGWYWRLSASGYMDCTEWSGPFETELRATIDMFETYETMDECGDELAEDDERTTFEIAQAFLGG